MILRDIMFLLFESGYLGFSIVSLLLIIISLPAGPTRRFLYKEIDHISVTIFRLVGIVYIVWWLYDLTFMFIISDLEDPYERYAVLNRMFGIGYFWYWINVGTYILITQLLWSKKVEDSKIIRIIMVLWLICILNMERLIIFVSSFNRDFIPGGWVMYDCGLTSNLVYNTLIKVFIYTCLVGFIYFIKRRIR